MSIFILSFSPEHPKIKEKESFLAKIPNLESQIYGFIHDSNFEEARQIIQSNREQIRLYSYEKEINFDNLSEIIRKNMFADSRLKIANDLLEEQSIPLFHWEMGRLGAFTNAEKANLTPAILKEFSRLYEIGAKVYYNK